MTPAPSLHQRLAEWLGLTGAKTMAYEDVAAAQATPPAAEPAPAPKPNVVATATALQAALDDLAAKRLHEAEWIAARKEAEAKVAALRTDWQSAVADVEAAFASIEGAAETLVSHLKAIL